MTSIPDNKSAVNRPDPAPGLPDVLDGCNGLIALVTAALAGRAEKASTEPAACAEALRAARFVLGQTYLAVESVMKRPARGG